MNLSIIKNKFLNLLLHNYIMEEFKLSKEDRDFYISINKLKFFPVSLLMMGLVTYYFSNLIAAIVSVVLLVIILLSFEFIEWHGDNFGKNN